MKYILRLVALTVFGLASLSLASGAVLYAQSEQNNAIARGFKTSDKDIIQGTLISTKQDGSGEVEMANVNSAQRISGIASKALVELSDHSGDEVQVLLSGTANALVSDINGDIKAGDKITASPLDGIGMLATEDAQIIGTAQADFNVNSSATKTVADKNGRNQTVHVGVVPIQIAISYYVAPTSQFVPAFLQNLANSIAGRPVSFLRIILSCILLLFAFGSITILIYTSVRSGIISLGRNPLAASAIQRSLVGVIIIVLLTVALGIASVYLVLTA